MLVLTTVEHNKWAVRPSDIISLKETTQEISYRAISCTNVVCNKSTSYYVLESVQEIVDALKVLDKWE